MHCDIKSYNILVKGDFSNCKLCDFGVCLPIDKDGNVDVVKAGKHAEYVGTPAWSAPEVSEYPQTITAKADIYAFGLVFWEMLALMPPIDEDTIDSFVESDEDSMVVEDKTSGTRRRPPLPDIDFGVEYVCILEVYNLCTHEQANVRPAANQLKLLFEEVFNNKSKM